MVSLKKVLFVDDDTTFLRTVEIFLSESFDVRTADSVKNACESFLRERYDAVVLDHLLGDEEGFGFLDRINGDSPPVIVLTGHPSESMQYRYYSYKAVKKMLLKPVDCNELELQLHTVISGLRWDDVNSILKNLHHSELRSNLYRYVLHDIKNLMTVMSGTVQLLSFDTNKQQERLQKIKMALDRVSRLIINAERINCSGHDSVQTVDLINYLEELVKLYTDMLEPTIKVTANFTVSTLPVRISRLSLDIAINNLIQNSIQAMEEGRIHLTVYVNPDNTAHILVQDNGCGIPAAVKNDLFLQMVTTKRLGKGIGLYISRNLLMDIGGDIHLIETSPKGSTFEIMLPPSALVDP